MEKNLFENIVIRRSDNIAGPIDPGLIAEALLFYDSAHLLLERGSLGHLLRTMGPECLLRLTDHGTKITYLQDSLTINTDRKANVPFHTLTTISAAGSQQTGTICGKEDVLEFIFERDIGKSRDTQKYARDFIDKVEFLSLSAKLEGEKKLVNLVKDDLDNSAFLKEAARIAVKGYAPGYEFPINWNFNIVDFGRRFVCASNLDFAEITNQLLQANPEADTEVTAALILNVISQGSLDLRLSNHFASDYATTSTLSQIAQARFGAAIDACTNNTADIQLFQDIVFDGAVSIREAINSGERSFDEFFTLLEKAKKFKEWLGSSTPDKKLIKQYHDETTARSVWDKLPHKSIRFVLATGLGLAVDMVIPTGVGTTIGVAVGAGDTFLLDRVLKGWKPSHFISGPMGKFVNK